MEPLTVISPAGVHPPAGYSHAVLTSGPLLHVSGQVALDPAGALVGAGDLAAQAEQAFANLDAVLAAASLAFDAVAALTIYIAGGSQAAGVALRAPLRRRITGAPPAMTVVFVAALMHPDWLIEIQATARAAHLPPLP